MGHEEIVKLLVNNNADVNIKTNHDSTSLICGKFRFFSLI